MLDQRGLALTRRFQQRISTIGSRAAQRTGQHWADLHTHDRADIPAFAQAAQPTLTAAKAAAVATGVAYYATLVRARPPSVRPADIQVDTNPDEPFISFWQALKNGHPIEDALLSGIARAEALAENLTVSASRLAGDATFAKTGHTFTVWHRAPDGNACPWCLDVADQDYRSAETADFGHDRCGCTPYPVTA